MQLMLKAVLEKIHQRSHGTKCVVVNASDEVNLYRKVTMKSIRYAFQFRPFILYHFSFSGLWMEGERLATLLHTETNIHT